MRRFKREQNLGITCSKAACTKVFEPIEFGGGALSSSKKGFRGYTLAEIVIVMLVIAVVVAVTIGVTKKKLDNIVTYTYYSAFSTLRAVNAQMLSDYKANDERYQAKKDEYDSVFPKIKNFFLANFGGLAVNADTSFRDPTGPGPENTTGTLQTDDDSGADDMHQFGDAQIRPGMEEHEAGQFIPGTPGGGCTGTPPACSSCVNGQWKQKTCSSGETLDLSTCECKADSGDDPNCTGDKVWNGSACVCPPGTEEFGTDQCLAPCTGGQIRTSSGGCECPEDKEWNGSQCIDPDNPDGSDDVCRPEDKPDGCYECRDNNWVEMNKTCADPDRYIWNDETCSCQLRTAHPPINGLKYCEFMASLVNTHSGAAECNGSSIAVTDTDFSEKTPDLTLRNNMRIYNIRQNPGPIADLAGNGESFLVELADGSTVKANEAGYTVYIDIDGENSASELWVDVYPFYITLDGQVIPAYDKDHPGINGGDSRNHMQVSIEDEVIDGGRRKIKWLDKSVSYKEAACQAGYIGANTPYCRDGNPVAYNNECSADNSYCRLKYIKPVKFLF